MYKIYMHTAPNGKKYIGQTCQNLERRWRNGNGYCRNPHFYRAIKKYGWESITHEVLCECETLEEANKVEAELIAKHKTNDIRHGYNISGGADGKGRVAESTKALLAKKHKGLHAGEKNPNYGRKHTEEERRKISVYLKEYYAEHGSQRKGTKASDESRKKMSEAKKKSAAVMEHMAKMNKAKAKRVLCVETGVVYESAHEAARVTGFAQGNISSTCRGEYKQAYGFRWEYV